MAFTEEELREPQPGRVSLRVADQATMPVSDHPKVSKKYSIVERVERCAKRVQGAFWKLDKGLSKLDGVTVTYSGKDFVNYARYGVFARAVIDYGLIRWHVKGNTSPIVMHRASDAAKVRTVLQNAYHRSRPRR